MTKKLTRVLKDVGVYSLGDVFAKGISFVATILYSRLLIPAELGVLGLISVGINFINAFAVLGGDSAYTRFFFEFKTIGQRRKLTTTWFSFLFLWALIVISFPLFFLGKVNFLLLRSDNYSLAVLLGLVCIPIQLLSALLNQALRNQFKVKIFISFNFFVALSSLALTLIFLKFCFLGVASFFLGVLIAEAVFLPLKLLATQDLIGKDVDFTLLMPLIKFGMPLVPTTITYWAFNSIDRIILKALVSFEAVGIYSIAASLSGIFALLNNAFGQAWSPHVIQVYEEDREEARKLCAQTLNLIVLCSICVILGALIVGKHIFVVIFDRNYYPAFYPMLILMIGVGFLMTTQITALGVNLGKKTSYLFYIVLSVSIVNIVLNYLLVPYFKEMGAAVATTISYSLLTFIYHFVSQKYFKIIYNKTVIFIGLGFVLFIVFFIFKISHA